MRCARSRRRCGRRRPRGATGSGRPWTRPRWSRATSCCWRPARTFRRTARRALPAPARAAMGCRSLSHAPLSRCLASLCPGDPTTPHAHGGSAHALNTTVLAGKCTLRLAGPGRRVQALTLPWPPMAGQVVEGTVDVDQSALTGESLPVTLRAGEPAMMGGTIVRGEVRRARARGSRALWQRSCLSAGRASPAGVVQVFGSAAQPSPGSRRIQAIAWWDFSTSSCLAWVMFKVRRRAQRAARLAAQTACWPGAQAPRQARARCTRRWSRRASTHSSGARRRCCRAWTAWARCSACSCAWSPSCSCASPPCHRAVSVLLSHAWGRQPARAPLPPLRL
jgi:hypothetical protein